MDPRFREPTMGDYCSHISDLTADLSKSSNVTTIWRPPTLNQPPIQIASIDSNKISDDTSYSSNNSFVEILPVIYKRGNPDGDFSLMINSPKYRDTLFLYNDNEEQFLAHISYIDAGRPQYSHSRLACSIGGGNAAIRPYQCYPVPRAFGIPTGQSSRNFPRDHRNPDELSGYSSLEESKEYIDKSFEYIARLIRTGRYKRVAYSANTDGYTLGTSIFTVSFEVKEYIIESIYDLEKIPFRPIG